MVLGFERINERVRHPNKYINFVKPMEGPDKAIAQDYLERIAAIVFPIMRDNHLSVMSLEEHEPNKEFWGRNFNFGEIIQLVLKGHNGMWLPLHHVQMVMIHELAHVKEMNHGRYFHRFRISMQHELEGLKANGYTGEGFWAPGRSVHLSANAVRENRPLFDSEIPLDLCGGFYQRAGGRRRRRRQAGGGGDGEEKEKITYAERKRRRIVKKFGSEEGVSVGADVEKRAQLDNSAYGGAGGSKPTKASMAKPRVALSNRGRELRLQAALARLGGPVGAGDDTKQESKPLDRFLADGKKAKNKDGVKKEETNASDFVNLADDDETEDDYESDGGEVTYVKAESDTEDEDKDELEKEFSELSCQPPRPREFRGKPVIAVNDNANGKDNDEDDDIVIMTPPPGAISRDKGKAKAPVDIESDDEASSPDTLLGDEPTLPAAKRRKSSVISIDDLPDDDLDVVENPMADDDLDIVDDTPDDDLDVMDEIPGAWPSKRSIISIGDDTDADNDLDLYEKPPTVHNDTLAKPSISGDAGTRKNNNDENAMVLTSDNGNINRSTAEQSITSKPDSTPTKSPAKTIDPASLKSPAGAPRSYTSLFGNASTASKPPPLPPKVPTVPLEAPVSNARPPPPPSAFSMNRVPSPPPQAVTCEVCSMPNDAKSTLCAVCSNVISNNLPSWKCRSVVCGGGDGKYRNSEDCGVCGVCGERKP